MGVCSLGHTGQWVENINYVDVREARGCINSLFTANLLFCFVSGGLFVYFSFGSRIIKMFLSLKYD